MIGLGAQNARRKLGLNHADMARLMGVSLRTLFRWEAEGVPPGAARVVYDLILCDELPAHYVEWAQARPSGG